MSHITDSFSGYLTHCVLPMIGSTGETMAEKTFQVLCEYASEQTLSAVLVDNAACNTGHRNGMVVHLEKLIGRNLHTIGCSLHQNELPMRAVFRTLDGVSSGPNSFSEPIRCICSKDVHLEPPVRFKPIKSDICTIDLSPEVIADLSCDQQLLYHYCEGISLGYIDESTMHRKVGPLNQARWLTLAIRVLAAYTREVKPPTPLSRMVKFIVKVYAPAWFEIKLSSKLKDMPKTILKYIHRLNSLKDREIIAIVRDSMQGNCFSLLPENFVYCLLLDDNHRNRTLGWKCALDSFEFPSSDRKKIPPINWKAKDCPELLACCNIRVLPPALHAFSREDLQSSYEEGHYPQLPLYPSHSQSVERAVKLAR